MTISVYSNSCCSCSFEPEIIKISQSSHKMYSNNIVNFQESTTILNAHTKKVWKLIVCTSFIYKNQKECMHMGKSHGQELQLIFFMKVITVMFRLVGWVLWHINFSRLFNAKSIFIQIISSISNNSVEYENTVCQKHFYLRLFSLVKQF